MEYSRESWNVVKKKTADSEREWHALRAEFAARRKLFKSAYLLGRVSKNVRKRYFGKLALFYFLLFSGDPNKSEGESSGESGFSTDNLETEPEENESAQTQNDIMTASTTTIKNEDNNIEQLNEAFETKDNNNAKETENASSTTTNDTPSSPLQSSESSSSNPSPSEHHPKEMMVLVPPLGNLLFEKYTYNILVLGLRKIGVQILTKISHLKRGMEFYLFL